MPGVFCQGAWRLEVLRGQILSVFASHSAVGSAWSILVPIRATDYKIQSSWSLNWSCWPVKNASFTEQLQGAHLNSEQYVAALLKLFSFFFLNFDSANCERVGFFFSIQFIPNVFANHKTPKSEFVFLLIVSSVIVYLNQMIELSALPLELLWFPSHI